MACISFGKFKKKIIFPISSILLSYIILNLEYFSQYFFDFKKVNSPNLYSLYFSFSFLGCFIFGGIFYCILRKNTRSKSRIEDKIQKEKNKKKNNDKANISISLIYNEDFNKIHINMSYFIFSAFLELLTNFSYSSIVFDFMDIESKILYEAFEIIFIKLISKCFFKFHLYRHQVFGMILLIFLLLTAIMFRETFLMKIVQKKFTFYESKYEDYIIKASNEKIQSGIIYYYYFIFIIVGLMARSFNICFDKWLITDKLCNPYKLLFFKGAFGFIPAFSIQFFLYFLLGENKNTEEDKNEEINIRNLYKRLSFPIFSFISNININIILIISFFIIVGLYYTSIMLTINEYNPEFIGFVSIFSSTLVIISIQFINVLFTENTQKIIISSLIHIIFFLIILIPSLIICEIIILHCCKCDKNISQNIDKRANLEVNTALKLYNEDDDEDNKTLTISEEHSSRSQD